MSNFVRNIGFVGMIMGAIEELDMVVHINVILQFHDVLRRRGSRGAHFGDRDYLGLYSGNYKYLYLKASGGL
jgi:hypothetical protein